MLPPPSIPSLKRLPLWHWNVRYAKMAALNYYTIKILIHLVINACKKNYYRLHVRIRTIAWKISNVDVRHMMRQAKLFMGSFGMVLFWYFANLHCPLRLCLAMIFWQWPKLSGCGEFYLTKYFFWQSVRSKFPHCNIYTQSCNILTYQKKTKSNWTAQEKCQKFFAASTIMLSKKWVWAKMMNQSVRMCW